jgi:hypothetical protein
MKKIFLLLLLPQFVFAQFQQYFSDKTLRIDYFHTGKFNQEIFALDQLYAQGVWAGSQINLIDTLNLGKYQIKIHDSASGQLIYSRGFSSLYGEWETTAEAKNQFRTFHESALVPLPQKTVNLIIAKRNRVGQFSDIWTSPEIDPGSRFVNREPVADAAEVQKIILNGPCATKVDFLILGDGYAKKDRKQFKKDVDNFAEKLFATEPYQSRQTDFNLRAICAPSQDSGIDEPRENRWKNNALDCSFNSFDLARYVLSLGNRKIRDLAALAPYDFLIIIFNSDRYGGGGIYQLYAIGYAGGNLKKDKWLTEYVLIHELGHSVGGLGDEYYASTVAYDEFYPVNVEPWEPNLTVQTDRDQLKWRSLVEPTTPIPTPWNQTAYDSLTAAAHNLNHSAVNYPHEYARLTALADSVLRAEPFRGKVGAFEGAGYVKSGIYRPYLNCRMFSKTLAPFDPVCQAAIARVLDFYAR